MSIHLLLLLKGDRPVIQLQTPFKQIERTLVHLDGLLYIVLTICILSRTYLEISATYGIVIC